MTPEYSATIEYLFNLQKFGIKLGLDTIRSFLKEIDSPHRQYPVIHIAGTNGKGSTAAMVASLFQAAGYRVGLYSSPHLVDFRERIRINGNCISEEHVIALTERLRQIVHGAFTPTFFEFTTAMAFSYFAAEQVDIAVIEVGLGGRFDATNVVEPLATCITTIALDHEQHLGSTLEAIAYEKGGILKKGVPAVIGRMGAEAMRVFHTLSQDLASPLYVLEADFACKVTGPSGWEYSGLAQHYQNIQCPLIGTHQLDNAACALALAELASRQGFLITESHVQAGFESLRWAGRLEIAETQPLLVLDGAHNPAAAQVVADFIDSFRHDHPHSIVILVIGMMRDKDHQTVLSTLVPHVDRVIVTQPSLPRAATVKELNPLGHSAPEGWADIPKPSDALQYARTLASPHDLICVTGSLLLVGELTSHMRGESLSPLRD